jgi:hypothetical protein
MGKHIITWSYWLGALCAVLALLTRTFDVLGVKYLGFATRGNSVGYHSFMDGALFFLVISIATMNYSKFHSQKP